MAYARRACTKTNVLFDEIVAESCGTDEACHALLARITPHFSRDKARTMLNPIVRTAFKRKADPTPSPAESMYPTTKLESVVVPEAGVDAAVQRIVDKLESMVPKRKPRKGARSERPAKRAKEAPKPKPEPEVAAVAVQQQQQQTRPQATGSPLARVQKERDDALAQLKALLTTSPSALPDQLRMAHMCILDLRQQLVITPGQSAEHARASEQELRDARAKAVELQAYVDTLEEANIKLARANTRLEEEVKDARATTTAEVDKIEKEKKALEQELKTIRGQQEEEFDKIYQYYRDLNLGGTVYLYERTAVEIVGDLASRLAEIQKHAAERRTRIAEAHNEIAYLKQKLNQQFR